MVSGPDHMGTPASFTARRPHASHLPSFELPPPPVKYPTYSHVSSAHSIPTSTTLTSVGNLLTPPSNGSTDGLSPSLPSSTSLSSHGAVPFAPSPWQSQSASSTPYGFQSASAPQSFSGRPIFSPTLGSTVRGTSSPTASEGLPPPPYEMSSYAQSMPMSAPSLPALPTHHHSMNAMMNGQHTPVSAPVSQASPVSTQDGFSRPPPTPSASYYSQPSSTPQQGSFSFSGPSPIAQSPMSAGGPLGKMSPVHQAGHVPSLQSHPQPQYPQHRQYNAYQMPVLSNVGNPNGQLALVGGAMPHGMMQAQFNSGHAAQMYAMHAHAQPPNPQNDRPFRCDQCPQSFNRNHDLKRHKRIHLAVKPFPCGHCDKSFSRKDALKRHVLVKGCGKAAQAEVKEMDGSISPKSEEHSPVITSVA